MRNLLIVLFSVFILMTLGCKKPEPQKSESNVSANKSSISFTVLKSKTTSTSYTEDPVQGAIIRIYESETERDNNGNYIKEVVTGSNGKASVGELTKTVHYSRVTHTSYGTLKSTISTPYNTISYETLVFP